MTNQERVQCTVYVKQQTLSTSMVTSCNILLLAETEIRKKKFEEMHLHQPLSEMSPIKKISKGGHAAKAQSTSTCLARLRSLPELEQNL